jgi:predicted nucleotidyltransferase component of viral defense system
MKDRDINPLAPRQASFLAEVGKSELLARQFYLTGGTALAAFYLRHRYSDDLDFFSEEEVDPLGVDVFLREVKGAMGIVTVDFQQSYNRNLFFLHFAGGEVLKTEFTYFPFPRLVRGRREYGVELDSEIDIAVNKLFTIYQRTAARDYVDLYCLCRERGFRLEDLVEQAHAKFDWRIDPLQLGAQFVKAAEVRDYPRMISHLEPREWQDFFLAEARKLKPSVIS